MRADLLDAFAAVHWAKAQFPALEERLKAWLDRNVELVTREADAKPTHNLIVLVAKEPLPLAFGVEVGAYINVLRSALDILAVAIGKRHGVTRLDNAYFPVAADEAAFRGGRYKGVELIKRISDADRETIEALKPYRGGNRPLWLLHTLDITRKHRRLLDIGQGTHGFSMSGPALTGLEFPQIAGPRTGWIEAGKDESPLVLIAKDAPKYEVQVTPKVFLAEREIGFSKPAVAALDEFASLVESIIGLFDG